MTSVREASRPGGLLPPDTPCTDWYYSMPYAMTGTRTTYKLHVLLLLCCVLVPIYTQYKYYVKRTAAVVRRSIIRVLL